MDQKQASCRASIPINVFVIKGDGHIPVARISLINRAMSPTTLKSLYSAPYTTGTATLAAGTLARYEAQILRTVTGTVIPSFKIGDGSNFRRSNGHRRSGRYRLSHQSSGRACRSSYLRDRSSGCRCRRGHQYRCVGEMDGRCGGSVHGPFKQSVHVPASVAAHTPLT